MYLEVVLWLPVYHALAERENLQVQRHSCPIDAPRDNRLMAYFKGFFDESGKHESEMMVSFCGFVESNWDLFENEWNYLLRRHKMTHLHIAKDGFRADAEKIRVYSQFVQVIKRTVEKGFAVAVDVSAFRLLDEVARKDSRDDPHFLAFSTVLRDVVKYVRVLPNPSVSIICDDEPSKACDCYKMFDVMRQNTQQPENRQTMKSITFADAKFYAPLQAADLLSWVARAEARYRFFGQDFRLRQLYQEFVMDAPEFRTTFTSHVWDAATLKTYSDNCIVALKG